MNITADDLADIDQNYYTDPDDVPYAAAPTSALAAAKQASSFVRTDMLNVIDVRWPRYEEA